MVYNHPLRHESQFPIEEKPMEEEKDYKDLGENVATHCMGPWHKHADGRICAFHNRLEKWAMGSGGVWDKECLRDHDS